MNGEVISEDQSAHGDAGRTCFDIRILLVDVIDDFREILAVGGTVEARSLQRDAAKAAVVEHDALHALDVCLRD